MSEYGKSASSRASVTDPKRPVVLRLARYVRHLEVASRAADRLDSLMSAVLLVQRPRWVDHLVLALRGLSAAGDEVDARVHVEVDRHGKPCWPCLTMLQEALVQHHEGTYFKGMHWYVVQRSGDRPARAVLSENNGSTLFVDGGETEVEAVLSAAWAARGGVLDVVQPEHSSEVTGVAGAPLASGHPNPVVDDLFAEFVSRERGAVLLLGPPGTGKSHVAEQLAGRLAAARASSAGRQPRVLRLPQFAGMVSAALVRLLAVMRPDVVVVHDADTDAPAAATLLRFAEACVSAGVPLVCTANATDGMHAAAFGDHRFGAPVVVDRAPETLLRAVLGEAGVAAVDAAGAAAWEHVRALPLASVNRLRLAVEAGRPLSFEACA